VIPDAGHISAGEGIPGIDKSLGIFLESVHARLKELIWAPEHLPQNLMKMI
jgi:hypothetical protein